jgi:hypothetical protein
MMEFNFLSEQKAIRLENGKYVVDNARMPAAIAAVAKELLEIEATGDRARAERWFAKYDKMPPALGKALAAITNLPVDVEPVYDFPVNPR